MELFSSEQLISKRAPWRATVCIGMFKQSTVMI
jgi:hypothetical protein